MSSLPSNSPILEGDQTFVAKVLWTRLNPGQWPFCLKDLPLGSALVGGAVRDGLLNKLDGRFDLDFVVPNDATEICKKQAS